MLRFQKLQATGNDFILLEDTPASLTVAQRAQLCDRHFGIGADGIIAVESVSLVPGAHTGVFHMYYWNADGHPGTFCGNGARAAFWMANRRWGVRSGILLAADGAHEAYLVQSSPFVVAVSLTLRKAPQALSDRKWFVDSGSPHLLIESDPGELLTLPVETLAPPLRRDTTLDPGGVNVSFFAALEGGQWSLRTYERGVEAETLSCGTACVALAAVTNTPEIQIQTRGGMLRVRRRSSDTFWLIGPVEQTFTGTYCGEL